MILVLCYTQPLRVRVLDVLPCQNALPVIVMHENHMACVPQKARNVYETMPFHKISTPNSGVGNEEAPGAGAPPCW